MKKVLFIFCALSFLLLSTTSCDKTKTYIQEVNDHNDAVKKFMKDSGFVVLNQFPSNGIFKANEFVRDTITGTYYNIMDYGDKTQRPVLGKEVYVRFTGLYYFRGVTKPEDVIKYSSENLVMHYQPLVMVYGQPLTFPVQGWAAPLRYIGNVAHVKMIVPFNAGFEADQNKYQPTYYENVVYRLEKE